jgi:hypothetical protein
MSSKSFAVKTTKWSYNPTTSQSENNIETFSKDSKEKPKSATLHDNLRTQGSSKGLSIKSVPGAAMEDYM